MRANKKLLRVPLDQLRESLDELEPSVGDIWLRTVGMALFAISASCAVATLTGLLPTPLSVLVLSTLSEEALAVPGEYWRNASVLNFWTFLAIAGDLVLFVGAMLCLKASDFNVWGGQLLRRDQARRQGAALPAAMAVIGLVIVLSILGHPRIFAAPMTGWLIVVPTLLATGVIGWFLAAGARNLVDTTQGFGASLVTVVISSAFILLTSLILAANGGLMKFFPLAAQGHVPTLRMMGAFILGGWVVSGTIAGRFPVATIIEVLPPLKRGIVRVPIVMRNRVVGKILLSFREANRDRLLVLREVERQDRTCFEKVDVATEIPLGGQVLDILDLAAADALPQAAGTVRLADRLDLLDGEVSWIFTFDGVLPGTDRPLQAEAMHVFMNRLVENGRIEGEMQSLVQRCLHEYVGEMDASADRYLTEQQELLTRIELESTRDRPRTMTGHPDQDLNDRIERLRARVELLEASGRELRARMDLVGKLVREVDVELPKRLGSLWASEVCPRTGGLDPRVVDDVDRLLKVADLQFYVNVEFGRSSAVKELETNLRHALESTRNALTEVEVEQADRSRSVFEDRRAHDTREHEAILDIQRKLADNMTKPENLDLLLNSLDGKKLIGDIVRGRHLLLPGGEDGEVDGRNGVDEYAARPEDEDDAGEEVPFV